MMVEDTVFRKTFNIKSTKGDLDNIKMEHAFEVMFQRQYEHMIERMKRDLIALQIKTGEMHDSYKSKEGIMGEETEKSRRAKEQKLQAKLRLDALMKQIDQEQKKR